MDLKVAIGTWEALPAMGGPAYYIDELVKRLSKIVDVTLIVPSYASIKDQDKLTVRKLSSIDVPIVRVYMFAVRASFLTRKLDVDLIHDNGVLGFSNKSPFIETWHHTNLDNRQFLSTPTYYLSIYRELLTAKGIKNSDSIIAVSELAKKELIELYDVPISKIMVAPHGVDTEFFKPSKSQTSLGLNDAEITLLYVGALNQRKNVGSLLKALKLLEAKFRLHLIIIGDGPEKKQLEALTCHLGISQQVTFLGQISREQLLEVYNTADYVILPSYKEGFGLTVLEALACDKPVVMTPVGISEIIKCNKLGTVSEGFTPDNIASAIENAITTKFEHLRDFVQANYSWSKTIEITLKAYKKVLENYK